MMRNGHSTGVSGTCDSGKIRGMLQRAVHVPRSTTKLAAVAGAILLSLFMLHRLTAPRTSLRDLSRHGNDMVGKKVQVYWPDRKEWYKARVTRYNVAGSSASVLEGTHTLVYEDDSVVNSHLHKLKYHVVYGKELIGHLISIYRPTMGFYKVANITAYDEEDEQHMLRFEDGGVLKLDLALEDFNIIFGQELVGKIIEIRRELRDEPLYATVLHFSQIKGTFVLAFADGTLQDIDLKGVSFEIVHNTAAEHAGLSGPTEDPSLALIPEVDPGQDEDKAKNYDSVVAAATGDRSPMVVHRHHSAAEYKEDPLRGTMLEFVETLATPGQIAILNHARLRFERGLQAYAKKDMEAPINWYPCAHENADCEAVQYCAKGNELKVRFGHLDFRWLTKSVALSKFPLRCSAEVFGSDPVVGRQKFCEIECDREEDEVKIVDQCSQKTLPFIHELAQMPMCPSTPGVATGLPPWETALMKAYEPFCKNPDHKPGMSMQLDCRYQAAYAKYVTGWDGRPKSTDWIERAYITFFAGAPGGAHAGMVTNLIRSVHMFSDMPIIVYAVNTTNLAVDWDPAAFPRLIVYHANSISNMNGGRMGVSFNFNKFRSMMVRVKTAIQLDADMLVAKHIDRLFDATAKHVTANYPYPIMPVHWMSRMKGADGYADAYPVNYNGFRIRWAHCHPTWTWHALEFVGQALMAKLNRVEWTSWVKKETGVAPVPIPMTFLGEDEDMLNVLLWRNNATKQWCKWDVEPSLYEDFLKLNTNQPSYSDTVWYKNGIPLVFIGMHNTKDPIATDKLLGKMRREGGSDSYTYHQGTYFSKPFDVEKLDHVHCLAI